MRPCPTCGTPAEGNARFCPFDGTPLADAGGDPLLGTTLGDRYHVYAQLGAGGMGSVYLARHVLLGRDVVVKVLLPHLQRDARAVARFQREAWSAARLDHDNTVDVFDFARTPDGRFYIVMEHVPGTSLGVLLTQRGRLDASETVHVLCQVATAMMRAHELGIVHRDLKPDNVLLTRRGTDALFVKVCDFGLARPLGELEASGISHAGELNGTPAYMAPEQWTGEPLDGRTDLYALGVMGLEMLAGRPPFHGNLPQLMFLHLQSEVPSLAALAPDATPQPTLEAILRTCMARERDRRVPSARDLLALLRAAGTPRPMALHTTYASSPPTIEDVTAFRGTVLDVREEVPELALEVVRLHDARTRRAIALSRRIVSPPWPAQRLGEAGPEVLARMATLADRLRKVRRDADAETRAFASQEAEVRAQVVASSAQEDASPAGRLRLDRRLASIASRASRAAASCVALLLELTASVRAEGVLLLELTEAALAALPTPTDTVLARDLRELRAMAAPLRELHALLDAGDEP